MRNDSIVDKLVDAEKIIQGFKTKQKIAGDSWQIYRAVTPGDEYDIYLTGPETSSTFLKTWKITYQVEGGRKNHPNAFAIFMNKLDYTTMFVDMFGNESGMINGFEPFENDDGKDACVMYLTIAPSYNWDSTTNSRIGVKFRAISPYKGRIIFEEYDV